MNKKNILFVCGGFGVGGVERVTVILINALVQRGYTVGLLVFQLQKDNLLAQLDSRAHVKTLHYPVWSPSNLKEAKAFMRALEITDIVNQWALPVYVSLFLRLCRPQGCKLYAVHHNIPNNNNRLQKSSNAFKRLLWRVLTGLSLKGVYLLSDAYVVLSPSYIPVLKHTARLRSTQKAVAIANPVDVGACPENSSKKNQILYVGRLELTQKRVDRILETWGILCRRLPDWELKIVGDGPDRAHLVKLAEKLPRIAFEGFQRPERYYAKSKILLLTSDFEGFGLVLVEGMAFGCVPVVLDSYLTAQEVVGTAGVLVPTPFNAEGFAQAVLSLASDEEKRRAYAARAKAQLSRYSVDAIVQQWIAWMNRD